MALQLIQDGQGKNTGVFIPIEDWTLMKFNYPDIDLLDKEIPEWQMKLLDQRMKAIIAQPTSIKPIDELFQELDKE